MIYFSFALTPLRTTNINKTNLNFLVFFFRKIRLFCCSKVFFLIPVPSYKEIFNTHQNHIPWPIIEMLLATNDSRNLPAFSLQVLL